MKNNNISRAIISIIVLFVLVGTYFYVSNLRETLSFQRNLNLQLEQETEEAERAIDELEKMGAIKIEKLKRLVLDEVKACEHGGAKGDFSKTKHFDPPVGTPKNAFDMISSGDYNLKIGTVIMAVKKFENRDIADWEALRIIQTKDLADALTLRILLEGVGGKSVEHWLNCAKNPKYGIAKTVEIIKMLEK